MQARSLLSKDRACIASRGKNDDKTPTCHSGIGSVSHIVRETLTNIYENVRIFNSSLQLRGKVH